MNRHVVLVGMMGAGKSSVGRRVAARLVRPFSDSDTVVEDRTGYRWGSFARESEAQLPTLFNGIIMVFRSFGDVSYAIVMDGPRLVQQFDELQHPKNRG